MFIRKTELSDLLTVMGIYEEARKFMRESGNPNQWVNNYPDEKLIINDISKGNSYVCVEGEKIVGVFCFSLEPDPTYFNIYEGSWLNDKPYGVIHRIASLSHRNGVASYCLKWCFERCPNIRIDTHRDNKIMQNFLIKHGFTKCGIIYLENGAERLAYQKDININ